MGRKSRTLNASQVIAAIGIKEDEKMSKCRSCKHLFVDNSVGYFECMKADDFSDPEFEEYELLGCVVDCPYYEPDDEGILI